MKRVLIVSIILFLTIFNIKYSQATDYLTYQDFEFEHKGPRFLDDYTEAMYEKYYKRIKKKRFWGWKVETAYKTETVYFTKETLYVIYNEGMTPFTETFKFKSKDSVKKQYNASGNIDLKLKGEQFGFKLGLDNELAWSMKATTTTQLEEEFSIKVLVDPNTQLFVEIRGEGQLSNGVAKYYRFWRGVRKGGWEVFVVTTEYYSLRKEIIDESKVDIPDTD